MTGLKFSAMETCTNTYMHLFPLEILMKEIVCTLWYRALIIIGGFEFRRKVYILNRFLQKQGSIINSKLSKQLNASASNSVQIHKQVHKNM